LKMDGSTISYIDKMDLDNQYPVETHPPIDSSYLGFKSTMRRPRGYAAIGLVNPKTPANIGGVIRAAGCYNASLVVMSGHRPMRIGHLATDTQKAYRHIPHIIVDNVFDAVPYDCVPVAVDLLDDAKPLPSYHHPERAFYIFGPEDSTLDKSITDRCRDKIYVPTTYCMNLAACVNIVLYDRMAKQ
jgi:tRNA(Leu) C34 or U34 (ribose-2'-O)-methylase TrmL